MATPQVATNKRYAGNKAWTVSEVAESVKQDSGNIDILVGWRSPGLRGCSMCVCLIGYTVLLSMCGEGGSGQHRMDLRSCCHRGLSVTIRGLHPHYYGLDNGFKGLEGGRLVVCLHWGCTGNRTQGHEGPPPWSPGSYSLRAEGQACSRCGAGHRHKEPVNDSFSGTSVCVAAQLN